MITSLSEKTAASLVTADESGLRLDRWFRRHHPAVSHGQLQKWLRSGQIRVDGKRIEASFRLNEGHAIRVPPGVAAAPEQQSLKRNTRDSSRLKDMLLFEDDDIIVLNKPAGLAVQGGTGLKENLDDMLEALRRQGHSKPKLVHRLDRDTSGILVVARNAFAAAALAEAFRRRDTRKIYWAITLGVPKPARGLIEAPLLKRGEIMAVAHAKDELAAAKSATTVYQVVESAKKQAAFVALWPVTGRTHQLRVHMAYTETPILGDKLYSGERTAVAPLPFTELGKGLHLHARRLIMPHPRKGTIDVTAPLGKDMRKTFAWFGFDPAADTGFEDKF